MKKCKVSFVLLLVLASIVLTVMLAACTSGSSATAPAELNLSDCFFNSANCNQVNASVLLGVYDRDLYMWHEGVVSKYENGVFRKVYKIDGSRIGFSDGYFYYTSSVRGEKYTYGINQYSLENSTQSELFQRGTIFVRNHYFTEDGHLHAAADSSCSIYKEIYAGTVLGEHDRPESYTMDSGIYTLTGGDTCESVLTRKDDSGQITSYKGVIPYGMKYAVPCEYGLLIHNENSGGNLLYLVEADSGNVVPLFETECIYSQSAFNLYGEYAYISLVRYTQWGPLGLGGLRDEQDQVNGTYRIDLKNYSVEKISDEIYNGLYIFDDSGIFACNSDYQVFKLDFNGNVLYELN